MEIDRAGKFDAQRAKEQGIPLPYWSRLQNGETIETEDKVYTPDLVLGPPRKGIKLTYTTDTRPTDSIKENAAGSDLFICEGMYGEQEKAAKAVEYKHMTFYEAAALAKEAEVEEMWLTHYSPSLTKPQYYMDEVRRIFPREFAQPGDRILDTHLGSGSSRIAAYHLGFDFVGFEIDKTYFDLQEQRFARHTAQMSLF